MIRTGPAIFIKVPKVTEAEILMEHEEVILLHSFIHSTDIYEYPPCSKHWGTPVNKIINYTVHWKV